MTDNEQNTASETANEGSIPPEVKGIGALLREERERKGLSYRAVAERMRLRPHVLEALEKEAWEALPPPAFLRGFLRTYARILSLDERILLDLYERAVPAKDGSLRSLVEKPGGGKGRHALVVLCMLIAVAALVFAWKTYISEVPGQGSEEKVHPVAESRSADVAVLKEENRPPLPEPPPADPVAPPGVPESLPQGMRMQTPPDAPPVREEREAAPAKPDTASPGEFRLRATVSARTWVRVQIDDSEIREYMFHPGNRPEWKARQGFYLIIGNAGGIDLNLNGEDIPKLGGSGQVVRLRLPRDFPRERGEE
jgi:cytoskeleton protein RodZ